MRPVVSVIIPVYNTEAFLHQAIDSILNQSLKELEIIAVDDGSSDGSLNILKDYGEKVKVISQTNSGQGAARNKGLSIAEGEFVYFMDSDDWIEPDTLGKCVECCRKESLDFVFFDAITFGADVSGKAWFDYHRAASYSTPQAGYQILSSMIERGIYRCSVCMCLYRRDFLLENELRFPEGILHEDEYFSAAAFCKARRTAGIDREFYHRRLRPSSVMTRSFTKRNAQGYLQTLSLSEKLKNSPECRSAIEAFQGLIIKSLIHNSSQLPLRDRLQLLWTLIFKKWRR